MAIETLKEKKFWARFLMNFKNARANVRGSNPEAREYPALIQRHFPKATHKTYIGRRAVIAGLGEIKRGGFDPLFSLNHSYAMFRDNLKRLTRRTWATTKDST